MTTADDATHVEVTVPPTEEEHPPSDDTTVVVVNDDAPSGDTATLLDHEQRITKLEGRMATVEERAHEAGFTAEMAENTAEQALENADAAVDIAIDAVVEEATEEDVAITIPSVEETLDDITPIRTPILYRPVRELFGRRGR